MFHRDEDSRNNFNLKNLSIVFGYNYENSSWSNYFNFQETPRDLVNLNELYIAEETDNYFTPNLFIGDKYDRRGGSRKTSAKCTWLQNIFIDIDIDNTGEIINPQEA